MERYNKFATGGLQPDLTFLCLLPPAEGRDRLKQRTTDRLDREDKRLAGYLRGVYLLNRHVAMEFGTTYASRVSSREIYDFVTRGMYAGIAASF